MNARAVILPILLAAALLPPAGARAQIGVPAVELPQLPRVQTPVDLGRTLTGATDVLDPRLLRGLRLERVRGLIRNNRATIEADPQGAPILRSEVVALSPSAAALDSARSAGFGVLRESQLGDLDIRIVVLRAPAGLSTRRALKQLRAADPAGTYDFNHIYLESDATVADAPAPPSSIPMAATPPRTGPDPPAQAVARRGRVGLIDGGVDVTHPAFRGSGVERHGCAGRLVPSAHGTAVASLLVGRTESFRGAAAEMKLYAADVYCGAPTGGALDAVVEALAWMARERVPVVNISLVGPPNALLENVARVVVARGHLLVAAVGNDGPAAKPLYPAAYPGVIGVTGVDARRRALLEACRGSHVDFAAPGADMAAARPGADFADVRGTSFAAPIVAGLLASYLNEANALHAARAAAELTASAVDLGSRGRDATYGDGLVGDGLRVAPSAVSARSNKSNH